MHLDHIGSFAALQSITGAEAYMHRADAPIAISGKGLRPMKAAPGLLRGLMFRLFVRPVAPVEGDLRKLSALDFQVACVGHGKPILKDAGLKFRRLWADAVAPAQPGARQALRPD